MDTVWIMVITQLITSAAAIINTWFLRWLDRAKAKEKPKLNPTTITERLLKKFNVLSLIFLGIMYIFAISYLSLKIYWIMNFPSPDMLKNSFNISLNMAAIVLLILNYALYFMSTRAFRFISSQHDINRHAQSRIFKLEEQINK